MREDMEREKRYIRIWISKMSGKIFQLINIKNSLFLIFGDLNYKM